MKWDEFSKNKTYYAGFLQNPDSRSPSRKRDKILIKYLVIGKDEQTKELIASANGAPIKRYNTNSYKRWRATADEAMQP